MQDATVLLITYYQLTVKLMAEDREGDGAEFMAALCCGGRACSSAWTPGLTTPHSRVMTSPADLVFFFLYVPGEFSVFKALFCFSHMLKGIHTWELTRTTTTGYWTAVHRHLDTRYWAVNPLESDGLKHDCLISSSRTHRSPHVSVPKTEKAQTEWESAQ